MDVNELLQEKREVILQIAAEHSDIDLLVDTMENTSPWFPVGLIQELEEILGRKVDLLTEEGIY
jgi:uncharacterized protein